MAQQLVNIGTIPGDGTGDTGYDAFDKVNDNFTELYNEASQIRNTRARVNYTAVTTATLVIADNDLWVGHNIFGVNYAGAVTITLPATTDENKIIIINDESGLAGTNNITLQVT